MRHNIAFWRSVGKRLQMCYCSNFPLVCRFRYSVITANLCTCKNRLKWLKQMYVCFMFISKYCIRKWHGKWIFLVSTQMYFTLHFIIFFCSVFFTHSCLQPCHNCCTLCQTHHSPFIQTGQNRPSGDLSWLSPYTAETRGLAPLAPARGKGVSRRVLLS